jgi:ATP-dependent Clp protease ATP-binding subunit ClpB
VTDEALAKLAHDGYDPAFGARPLKRLIQTEVGDRLAMGILEGKVVEGDVVTLAVEDGQFAVS